MDNYIITYTGKKVNPLTVNEFDIKDIAHALSNKCRFSGHTKKFYSVGQHCILASMCVEMCLPLVALLHDASEAYLTDIPSPFKQLPQYKPLVELERDLENRIFEFFVPNWDVIKNTDLANYKPVDRWLLELEMKQLLFGEYRVDDCMYIHPESPEKVEKDFLKIFWYYLNKGQQHA